MVRGLSEPWGPPTYRDQDTYLTGTHGRGPISMSSATSPDTLGEGVGVDNEGITEVLLLRDIHARVGRGRGEDGPLNQRTFPGVVPVPVRPPPGVRTRTRPPTHLRESAPTSVHPSPGVRTRTRPPTHLR